MNGFEKYRDDLKTKFSEAVTIAIRNNIDPVDDPAMQNLGAWITVVNSALEPNAELDPELTHAFKKLINYRDRKRAN